MDEFLANGVGNQSKRGNKYASKVEAPTLLRFRKNEHEEFQGILCCQG
jgi:hypothetical protein